MVALFSRFLVICWQLLVLAVHYLGGRLLCWIRGQRGAEVERLRGRRLTAFLCNLGPTFIKLGQILSTRRDLLPAAVIGELERLQDRVPALPFAVIRQVVEQDLGRELTSVYYWFDRTPLAAGSIAQVHRAQLWNGELVAVKVQRPGIARLMGRDLALVAGLARLAHRVPALRPLGLPGLADELSRAILSQLDFRREQANNRRFARNFSDVDHVSVPPLHAEACGEQVITMGLVQGHKLTHLPADRAWDRKQLARRLVAMYHHMLFQDSFLHADLHPANILVGDDGSLTLIDTGLVYEIPPHYVEKVISVGSGLITRNARAMVQGYLAGTDVPAEQREQAVAEVQALLEDHVADSVSELQVGQVMAAILKLLRRHGIQLDAEWTGIILSDLTFIGIAKSLDREVDILQLTMRALPGLLARRGLAAAAAA